MAGDQGVGRALNFYILRFCILHFSVSLFLSLKHLRQPVFRLKHQFVALLQLLADVLTIGMVIKALVLAPGHDIIDGSAACFCRKTEQIGVWRLIFEDGTVFFQ